ncbi:MAG: hypothetical protein JWO41_598 [Candidatus Saccharibacteria bacterium]|nr:hypothetical protein [Candidatus Saccharibacteria bacterium]
MEVPTSSDVENHGYEQSLDEFDSLENRLSAVGKQVSPGMIALAAMHLKSTHAIDWDIINQASIDRFAVNLFEQSE